MRIAWAATLIFFLCTSLVDVPMLYSNEGIVPSNYNTSITRSEYRYSIFDSADTGQQAYLYYALLLCALVFVLLGVQTRSAEKKKEEDAAQALVGMAALSKGSDSEGEEDDYDDEISDSDDSNFDDASGEPSDYSPEDLAPSTKTATVDTSEEDAAIRDELKRELLLLASFIDRGVQAYCEERVVGSVGRIQKKGRIWGDC